MALAKLLNLIAVSSLAILACNYGVNPVSALSVDTHNLARSPLGHAALAKKKRAGNKRCKPRPSSSSASKPTTTAAPPSKPTTTSKAAAPTTSKASSGGGGGGNTSPPPSTSGQKAGLAWPQDDYKALANFKTPHTSVLYNWSPYAPPEAKKLGFNPIPMLWGDKQISEFQRLVKPGYANIVFGMNEPNQQGQSDMTPQHGVDLWRKYIQPLKAHGYQLISPAPTNAPTGKTWLQNFIKLCPDCTLDGIAVHYYGTDPNKMIAYLEDIHNTFNRPVWVTEFACETFGGARCSSGDVWNWMQTLKSYMDRTSFIAHYFAFGAMYDMGNVNPLNSLLASNGQPTDLGRFYIN